MAKIPSISIVLNIGSQKPVSSKSKPPSKKKKREQDETAILIKSLSDIKKSIDKLPHTSHSGGS
jgi:hypothetical protein